LRAGGKAALSRSEPQTPPAVLSQSKPNRGRRSMGKGILLWLLGIPIPIILLLLIFWH